VIHQALILQIVFTQFSEVVTERLTTCKKLFVGAKTTVKRMTQRIDYLGSGQRNPQQADKDEVIWILVDEIRCTSAKLARGLDVIIPDFFPVLLLKIEEVAWK